MCRRYSQTAKLENLTIRFRLEDTDILVKPRYNLAPGQVAQVIINEGKKTLKMMQWGLIPSWSKDPSSEDKVINVRAETLTEKSSFKTLLSERRCLVLADGFYEWSKGNREEKIPIRYVLKTREPFAFAGLWDSWRKPDREFQAFTIITTGANDVVRLFHDRMPVILRKNDEGKWLDPELKDPTKLLPLLKPYPPKRMESYPVSRLVNSPTFDTLECILPENPF